MAYLINLRIRAILVYISLIVVLPRVCILNVIYSLSCWTHPLIIIFFRLMLDSRLFCWTFRTCFLVVICTFLLCQVSAPKLWIILTLVLKQSNYVIKLVLLLMLRWTLIEFWRIRLYVSLGSHRYGTLEGNLVYVQVMDLGFGSWQIPS